MTRCPCEGEGGMTGSCEAIVANVKRWAIFGSSQDDSFEAAYLPSSFFFVNDYVLCGNEM